MPTPKYLSVFSLDVEGLYLVSYSQLDASVNKRIGSSTQKPELFRLVEVLPPGSVHIMGVECPARMSISNVLSSYIASSLSLYPSVQ